MIKDLCVSLHFVLCADGMQTVFNEGRITLSFNKAWINRSIMFLKLFWNYLLSQDSYTIKIYYGTLWDNYVLHVVEHENKN